MQYKSDSVFGQQFLVDLNAYQLLGLQKPPKGTDWDVSLDYMSMRGLGYGTTYQYQADNLFGIPGHSAGMIDYWGIHDTGYDNLGVDRSHLKPEADDRYRFLLQHREELPDGFQLTVEGGVQSDRNFLEEYFRHEWDELKDQTTDVELKQTRDNTSWNVFASIRTDDFVTQTAVAAAGRSLLAGPIAAWATRSPGSSTPRPATPTSRATPPSDPNDQPFSHLPWEASKPAGRSRLISRQELDCPLQLGLVKVVPFALGEVGYWGEDINGQQLSRVYGQARRAGRSAHVDR